MQAGLPTLLCSAIALAATALDASEHGGVRAKLLEEMKRQFKYQPRPESGEAPDEPDAPHGILVLPELNVIEAREGVELLVREQRERLEREQFSWRHGGTIKKLERLPFKPTLMWKYNPEHNGIDLLNFSW